MRRLENLVIFSRSLAIFATNSLKCLGSVQMYKLLAQLAIPIDNAPLGE